MIIPLKAKFYANSLLTDLDSGNCVTEIGIAGLYNYVGLVLWEVNDRQRSLTAFQNAINYKVNNQDSIQKDLLGIYYNLSALFQELGKFKKQVNTLISQVESLNVHMLMILKHKFDITMRWAFIIVR